MEELNATNEFENQDQNFSAEAENDEPKRVDNFFETDEETEVSKLKTSAEIFGVSTRELESEFIDYKIEKLLRRIDYLCVDALSEISLKERIVSCRKNGFGSITVLPMRVASAKRFIAERNIEINSLVSYPFGDDFSKIKTSSAKMLARMSVSSISTPISPLMLGFYRLKTTEKELRQMKKILKKGRLKVIVNLGDFNHQMIVNLVRICLEVGVDAICVKVYDGVISELKQLLDHTSNRICVEAIGEISLKMGASMLNMGVSRLSAQNADSLSDELVKKLRD